MRLSLSFHFIVICACLIAEGTAPGHKSSHATETKPPTTQNGTANADVYRTCNTIFHPRDDDKQKPYDWCKSSLIQVPITRFVYVSPLISLADGLDKQFVTTIDASIRTVRVSQSNIVLTTVPSSLGSWSSIHLLYG